jgi:hypothetical protein
MAASEADNLQFLETGSNIGVNRNARIANRILTLLPIAANFSAYPVNINRCVHGLRD